MSAVESSPKKRPSISAIVVGDDARLPRYRARADRVALGRIIFTGRRNDVENYYAAADAVALPSLQEAFGKAVLKGALFDGIVEDPDDPAELEKKLFRLLDKAHDPAIAQEARQIAEVYSWSQHFHRFEAILRESCGASARARVC